MKRILSALRAALPDLLLVLAGGLISTGAGLIYLPAGFITAGVLLAAGVVLDGYDERSEQT